MRTLSTQEGLDLCRGCILVPTMGALHDGHRALITAARRCADAEPGNAPVVVTLFVNPAQFNEPQDFDRYPRTPEADAALCEQAGADVLFAPTAETVYPPGITLAPPPLPPAALTPRLEDAFRPGHFEGVCLVCARLFDLTRPRAALFGEKDWQQLTVLRQMVRALQLPIEIIPHPTVREPDGLAMSSRNTLLTPNHRKRAAAIPRALAEAGRRTEPAEAERAARAVLLANRIAPEYTAVRDAQTLGPARPGSPARVLIAARIAGVRLIDNAPWPGFTL